MKSFGLSRRGPLGLASSEWGSQTLDLESGCFTEESPGLTIHPARWGIDTISRNRDCITRCNREPAKQTSPDYTKAALDASGSNHPLRVMVVEDSKDTADSLAILLSHWGIDVHVCRDGVEALAAALTYRPDIALIDVMMPIMHGYELARRLRQHEELKDVLLIAITGLGDPDNRRLAQEAGFAYHLLKPWVYQQLKEILATLVRKNPEGYRSGIATPP